MCVRARVHHHSGHKAEEEVDNELALDDAVLVKVGVWIRVDNGARIELARLHHCLRRRESFHLQMCVCVCCVHMRMHTTYIYIYIYIYMYK